MEFYSTKWKNPIYVLNILLQVLDDGRRIDSTGKTVDHQMQQLFLLQISVRNPLLNAANTKTTNLEEKVRTKRNKEITLAT
jgi:ATP-dependent Clp protease ATP-binding subunit ClpA